MACHQAGSVSKEELLSLRTEFEDETLPFKNIIVSSEAFQNVVKDERLNVFFRRSFSKNPKSPGNLTTNAYDIHVICYLREFLDFAKSAWSQKIQATGTFCSLREYCARLKRFSLRTFLGFWETFADNVEFVSYENACKKANGVVSDFVERLKLNLPAGQRQIDSNPTISGNLLVFKLVMNKVTPHDQAYYPAFHRLALAEPRFREPFRISKSDAAHLRREYREYNETLRSTVDAFPEKDFSDRLPLYDPANWSNDIERFLAEPELAHLRELNEIRRLDPGTWNLIGV